MKRTNFTLIFSSAWNCSSLYVNDRVARSRSKCCHESYKFNNIQSTNFYLKGLNSIKKITHTRNRSVKCFARAIAFVLHGHFLSRTFVFHSELKCKKKHFFFLKKRPFPVGI